MKRFVTFRREQHKVSKQDLNKLEAILDGLYSGCGIDIKFTKHFLDKANDARNKQQITVAELQKIFREAYFRYCKVLPKMKNTQAVLHDLQTDINIPFIIQWNSKENMLDLVTKTIMRKKDFKSSNRRLNV